VLLHDLPERALVAYRTRAEPPADLDEFWERTLADARRASRPAELQPVDTGLGLVSTWDVTLAGFDGDPVRAWYHRPAGTRDDLPVVVRYHGYGGGRGLPHEVGVWPLAGYACLVVDTHGQGSAQAGCITRGILDPDTYSYRRIFTDAVLAAEAAATLPGVDAGRIVVAGASQGGGVSVAVAALAPHVTAVLADTPFLSDFRRGAEIADRPPYSELRAYLAAHPDRVERAFDTLGYFDVSILARRARAPALFSVALMDAVCPPSTVYAAYNAYAGPKQIRSYPFNEHEGGHAFHEAEQLGWMSGGRAA
jgi:cephalosporin-C deacetylase